MNQEYVLRDALLVRNAAEGHEEALAQIIAGHEASMVRVAFVILGDRDAANDAVLSAWPRVWKSLAKLRDPARLDSWLLAIAANEARKQLRAQRRRRSREMRHAEANPVPTGDRFTDPRIFDLHTALQSMRADDREILGLRFAGGLSSPEIAAIKGTTDSAIRGRLARALKRLREEMTK
jgi:RNA polymerase sigma-70 factor (ECF subfamily)